MVQLAFTASDNGQLLLWAKLPLVVMLLISKPAEPQLVRVTAWAALVVPVLWFPNVKFPGERHAPASGFRNTMAFPHLDELVVLQAVTVTVCWPVMIGAVYNPA